MNLKWGPIRLWQYPTKLTLKKKYIWAHAKENYIVLRDRNVPLNIESNAILRKL